MKYNLFLVATTCISALSGMQLYAYFLKRRKMLTGIVVGMSAAVALTVFSMLLLQRMGLLS